MIQRWKFYRPELGEYTFLVNPSDNGTPGRKKNLVIAPTTASDGKVLLNEGREEVPRGEFSGIVLSRSEYDAIVSWFGVRRQVRVTDDLGRQYWIYITEFAPQRVRSAHYPWKHSYTVQYTLLDWPFPLGVHSWYLFPDGVVNADGWSWYGQPTLWQAVAVADTSSFADSPDGPIHNWMDVTLGNFAQPPNTTIGTAFPIVWASCRQGDIAEMNWQLVDSNGQGPLNTIGIGPEVPPVVGWHGNKVIGQASYTAPDGSAWTEAKVNQLRIRIRLTETTPASRLRIYNCHTVILYSYYA